VCRREGINPVQFYRWRDRYKAGAIEGLKANRRGRKPAEAPEIAELKQENERLKTALCESSIELQLLKKSVSSGYMET
jgi:transposase-like protein